MQNIIPDFLYNILKESYGEELVNEIARGYKCKRKVTFRVNTLKTSKEKIKLELENAGIEYRELKGIKQAIIIENAEEEAIRRLHMYEDGEIYLQSLSSMLPPLVLEPKPNENILDMAAAPGGKKTELAALSSNEAIITACEKNKIRAERLKYNLDRQGATRVSVMIQDARKLDSLFSFDKILLDSPCSGSGTLDVLKDTFTEELIQRAKKTQEELLKKAIEVLKPGGELVYSTCSILKEENEEIIKKVLTKGKVEIVPIEGVFLKEVPRLPVSTKGTVCILPNEFYEGFFIAKLKKK